MNSGMPTHLSSLQFAGMPRDLQIPSRLREMAAEEEFAGFVLFYSFADEAFASDVYLSLPPWRLAFEECVAFAEEVDAASVAAEVAVFEFAVATANRL